MKRCKLISCWTDYPIKELGDEDYQQAPLRQVIVLNYDGDKYVNVQLKSHPGIVVSFNYRYLYTNNTDYKCVNHRKISRMINQQTKD